jgi:predicted DNA-binding protein
MGITAAGWHKRQNNHPPVGKSVLVKMEPKLFDALANLASRESMTNAELVRSMIRKAAEKLEWYKNELRNQA